MVLPGVAVVRETASLGCLRLHGFLSGTDTLLNELERRGVAVVKRLLPDRPRDFSQLRSSRVSLGVRRLIIGVGEPNKMLQRTRSLNLGVSRRASSEAIVTLYLRSWWNWMTSRPMTMGPSSSRSLGGNAGASAITSSSPGSASPAYSCSSWLSAPRIRSRRGGRRRADRAVRRADRGQPRLYGGVARRGALLAQEPAHSNGPRLMKAGLLLSLAVVFAPALLWTIIDLVGLASRLLRLGAG